MSPSPRTVGSMRWRSKPDPIQKTARKWWLRLRPERRVSSFSTSAGNWSSTPPVGHHWMVTPIPGGRLWVETSAAQPMHQVQARTRWSNFVRPTTATTAIGDLDTNQEPGCGYYLSVRYWEESSFRVSQRPAANDSEHRKEALLRLPHCVKKRRDLRAGGGPTLFPSQSLSASTPSIPRRRLEGSSRQCFSARSTVAP